jgi:hypothetical protein
VKVGDLVKVVYGGEIALVTRIERSQAHPEIAWAYLHTGKAYRISKLEIVNESR